MSAKLTKSTLGSDVNTADVLTPNQPGELKTTEFFAVGSLEDFSNDPRYLNIDLRKIATTKSGKVSQTIAPFKDLVFSAGNQVLREIARLELVEVHLRKSIGWTCTRWPTVASATVRPGTGQYARCLALPCTPFPLTLSGPYRLANDRWACVSSPISNGSSYAYLRDARRSRHTGTARMPSATHALRHAGCRAP